MCCITQCNVFGQVPEQQCDSLKAGALNLERSACLARRHCSIQATDLDGV
jgi:hypothetical protein